MLDIEYWNAVQRRLVEYRGGEQRYNVEALWAMRSVWGAILVQRYMRTKK